MKSGQKGFTVVEALLLLILLAIMGFTGYYVWHSQKQTNNSLNAASNTKLAAPAKKSIASGTSKSSNMIVFKEFGVQIPASSALKGLTYTVSSGGINLITPELSAAIAKCNGQPDDGKNSFYLLTKNAGTYKPNDLGVPGLLKQFSSFWIGGTSSVGGVTCGNQSDEQNLSNLIQAVQPAVQQSFKSATLVQ